MELNQHQHDEANLIKTLDQNGITINDRIFHESCIVSRNHIISGLNVTNVAKLTTKHIEQLLSCQPDVIILGSGEQHTFPDVQLLEPIAINDIGFEVMNNKSAARTYNILLAEERNVACLLIIA